MISGYAIDISHESDDKEKQQYMVNRDNFAGIETGDAAGTLAEHGHLRIKKKIKDAIYFAVILKNETILFYMSGNYSATRWERHICTELKHGELIKKNIQYI